MFHLPQISMCCQKWKKQNKKMKYLATEHLYITLLVYHLTCIPFKKQNKEHNQSDTRQFEPASSNSHSSLLTCCAHNSWTLDSKFKKKKASPAERLKSPVWILRMTTGRRHSSITAVEMSLNTALNLHLLQRCCSVAGNRLHRATSKCVWECLTRRAFTFLILCSTY